MKRMWVVLAIIAAVTVGCKSPGGVRYGEAPKSAVDTRRDTNLAAKLNVEAVELLRKGELKDAEKKLKDSLSADLLYGPAHNNLGNVYQAQERYYEAAWEFQYAAKLMPGKAQPKNNLGLVFEAVGRLDESAKWYDEALALEPDNVEITGNLARVMMRTDRRSNKTKQLLSDIVMKDRRPEWVAWARKQLNEIGQPQNTPASSGPNGNGTPDQW